MKECFADSFVFFALLNPKDNSHAIAIKVMRSLHRPMVTTGWILNEVADGLCASTTKPAFLALEQRLRADSRVVIVPANPLWQQRGIDIYRSRLDKDWSLTDCISFAVMTERKITDALTGDHHFEQAGFRALLK
jgi:predicted nucleic acid-binding protein